MKPSHRSVEDAAFTHALVALAAKLAAVDGAPNHAELAAFAALFAGDDAVEEGRLKGVFLKHISDHSTAFQYARQILAASTDQPELHRELIARLVRLAGADAALNAAEFELIRAIAAVFNIHGEAFKSLMAQYVSPARSPYELLGIASAASDEQVRAHYLAQVQKLHPDRYQAAGASPETVAMLSDQLAALNAAYEAVRTQRAKKSWGFSASRTHNKGAKG